MAVKKIQRRARVSLRKPVQQVQQNKEQKQINLANIKDKKVFVIIQEIKFARLLSSNDKRVRERVLKNLRKWLTVRSQSSFVFTKSDFMRLWKGLFYCMWMSDKPLIQEELADSLSKIVHCFYTKDVVLLYTTCALQTLSTEWIGIDQYRLDKFSMLVRRIIRQTFEVCKRQLWNIEWIKDICKIFETLLTSSKVCVGFKMHLTEVLFEELAKISEGNISEDIVTEFVKAFITYFISMDDGRQIGHVMKHIFRYLIFQSDVGMDYTEKFQAWKAAGFPTGSIDAMDRIEISNEDVDEDDNDDDDDNDTVKEKSSQNQIKCNIEKPLDPRAGRVDVELPQIPFNPKKIAELLAQYKFHPSSTAKSRRQLRRLINEFTELSQGKMPVGIKEVVVPEVKKKDTNPTLAAKRLLAFEEELYSDKAQKHKRKRNGQLEEHDKDDSIEEESESINDEHDTTEVNEEIVKKKRKVQSKMNDTNNLTQTDSEAPNGNALDSKNKKCNITEVTKVKKSSSKLEKKLSLVKNINKCKNLKLKGNKMSGASILNIATSIKRKKSTKLKVGDKWEVSDNTDSTAPTLLNDDTKESHAKPTEKLLMSETNASCIKKNNIVNNQPMWLVPVLKKLENETSKTSKLKEQHKVSADTSPKKRVKIVLQRNTAQHTSEYIMQIQKSPAIPFDANKKPAAGVLKASPIPSPINPFYKRKIT